MYLPDHPLATKSGYVDPGRFALYARLGPGPHTCTWCGRSITWRSWQRTGSRPLDELQVDHVDGNHYNNVDTNIVPACGPCNLRRYNAQRPRKLRVCVDCGKALKRPTTRCRQCYEANVGPIQAARMRAAKRR